MGNVAFVFSGQGDQFPGMGKELCDGVPEAAEIFALCDSIRPGTSRMCFYGSEDELKETKNTQPCLYAMELAAARAVSKEVKPAAAAGFSLGEVTAAAFAGLLSDGDGFRLVCRRGELMQEAAEAQDTSMAAVVKLTPDVVEELCSRYDAVYPVNYNCPGQVSVSGLKEQMASFAADVKAAGGRAIPLKVNGAFHSPFMEGAAASFAAALSGTKFGETTVPLYSDMTAEPYSGDALTLLSRQICNPVRWEALIRNMITAGIDTFVEIGPGRTLTNMIKKIDAGVEALTFGEFWGHSF